MCGAISGTRYCLEDVGDEGVNVGNRHFAITVHVGTAFLDVRASQDNVDNAIHIGDIHLAITVHVTRENIDFPGEIAGIAWALVNTGTGGIHMVRIIQCALATDKMGTAIKHVAGFSHLIGAPAIAGIYRFQMFAAIEHIFHVPHIPGNEVTQVKNSQGFAAQEHTAHVGHFLCVEAAQVKGCQGIAALEHVFHLCHIPTIETTQVNGFQ